MCMYLYIYIQMYMHVYIDTYTYIYTHVYQLPSLAVFNFVKAETLYRVCRKFGVCLCLSVYLSVCLSMALSLFLLLFLLLSLSLTAVSNPEKALVQRANQNGPFSTGIRSKIRTRRTEILLLYQNQK